MVSTRGRYALQVMIDLAEHSNGEFIPMKDVAKRQSLSLKYLERILPVLTKNNLVTGVHGKGGGYRLNRAPESYRVGGRYFGSPRATLRLCPVWTATGSMIRI